ncbi:MAG: nuclear transport factor 2 family protein [Nitrososphaerota archaeon]|jgi:ketosteroid isomerase-like protein|nr:nuclear transport factor 2 family protein [Nitrososphaerota archaeon]MDG6924161.1 nuclear transport factor 2 family protein [Nitrososphaerota archaeon]
MPHQWTKEQLRRQVKNAIYRVFDAAKSRDFGILASMHYPEDELFSKFDYSAPYKRQTVSQALMHEEVAYSNITDFNYEIDELRIDLITQGVAIATFHLETGGLFVNDYRFEGSPARTKLRASMVFLWKDDQWLIVHEHFSSFPDEPAKKEKASGLKNTKP